MRCVTCGLRSVHFVALHCSADYLRDIRADVLRGTAHLVGAGGIHLQADVMLQGTEWEVILREEPSLYEFLLAYVEVCHLEPRLYKYE